MYALTITLLTSGAPDERPLVFRDQPLVQVCETLEKHLEVKFSVSPSLKQQRITADFSSQRLEAILEDIAFVLNVRYDQRGRVITIRK